MSMTRGQLTICIGVAASLAAAGVVLGQTRAPDLSYAVVDGVSIPEALGGLEGDAERGAALFAEDDKARCASCHSVQGVSTAPAGAGPALDGVGLRLSKGALRLWIVNPAARVEASDMPAYYSLTAGLAPGDPPREAPLLSAQDIEDLVAFLDRLGRDG